MWCAIGEESLSATREKFASVTLRGKKDLECVFLIESLHPKIHICSLD
jgi:hypothetical protein